MNTVKVNLNKEIDDSYEIFIGTDLFPSIADHLAKLNLAHSYAIITDSNVSKLYGKKLEDQLKEKLQNVVLIEFEAGEKNKSRETKAFIEDQLLNLKYGRDSAIIALGGGVVGDLAGYIAATYARGVAYIQVATSLVAAVDSSIGGKTAVDTPYGKNLIGSFHQPKAVFIDLDTLHTLHENEIREGLAETIKYGVISDSELFNIVETQLEEIFNCKNSTLQTIIERSCKIKAEVVEKDEKENNLRKILNFGHTVGHAVEQLSNYSLTHGNAISIGMVLEGKIALEIELWNEQDQNKLESLLNKAGLPTELPNNFDIDKIIETMKLDKKARNNVIEMSLPSSIGKMAQDGDSYSIKIDDKIIKNAI